MSCHNIVVQVVWWSKENTPHSIKTADSWSLYIERESCCCCPLSSVVVCHRSSIIIWAVRIKLNLHIIITNNHSDRWNHHGGGNKLRRVGKWARDGTGESPRIIIQHFNSCSEFTNSSPPKCHQPASQPLQWYMRLLLLLLDDSTDEWGCWLYPIIA